MRFAIAVLLTITSSECGAALHTVALSGQQVPGMAAGVEFSGVGGPVLNNAGQILFSAGLTGPGTDATNGGGIWLVSGGTLELVVRRGDPAPGTAPGTTFAGGLFFPDLNEAGQVVVSTVLATSGVDDPRDRSIWLGTSGSLEKVARAGEQAPGTLSGEYFYWSSVQSRILNDLGQTMFWSWLADNTGRLTNDDGIWVGGPDSLQLITRPGIAAPGTETGVVFANIGDITVPVASLNNVGQTAFRAGLAGPGVDTTNDDGVWFWNGSSSELIAREGDQAPGTDPGVKYSRLDYINPSFSVGPIVNDRSQVAFMGLVSGSGIDATNDSGIWLGDSDSLDLVARGGDLAPGTGPNVKFAFGLVTNLVLNGAGEIAFIASVAGPGIDTSNDTGIWSGTADSLRLVAREGDAAPGAPPGVRFDDSLFFGDGGSLAYPNLNIRGQAMFLGNVIGPGIDATNNTGIWAETANHVLKLIAREGDQLEVAPGDSRTISYFDYFDKGSGNQDGRRSMFNDQGELAFAVHFTDGSSGVFLSDLVAVPEPAAGFLGVIGFGWAICGSRQRVSANTHGAKP